MAGKEAGGISEREEGMNEMKKVDYGIVGGGQGRTPRDTEDAGFWFAACMIAFVVIVILALLGWWRESEREGEPVLQFVPNAERY